MPRPKRGSSRNALAERRRLSLLRIDACARRCEAQDDAVPLPDEGLPEAVQRSQPVPSWSPASSASQVWAIAIYLMTTNLKGISSMKLHREVEHHAALGVVPRAPSTRVDDRWRRRRKPFAGPVEVDETHVGGKAKSMHARRKREIGIADNPLANKTTVAGVRDRETGKVRAAVVPDTEADTLRGFVTHCAAPTAMVYSDGAPAYGPLALHESVNHGVGEYVRGKASINGMESFWSMLKRGYVGTFHRMSREHLHRYVGEFEGRHNTRGLDTADQMAGNRRGQRRKAAPLR